MSSFQDILNTEFELWVDNLKESTAALSALLDTIRVDDKDNISLLQQHFDETEVDASELEKFRPSAKSKNLTYDFSPALKPLATSKRLLARANTILRAAGKEKQGSHTSSSKQINTTRAIPEMKINKFTGDITQFNSFITAFNLKYEHLPITKKEKLQHLKDHIEGDPLMAIQTLDLTDENYDRAITELMGKYDNKDEVISSLYYKLEQLPRADSSNASLRSTYFEIEGLLSALESHGHVLDSFPPLRDKVYFKYPQWLVYQICGQSKPTIKKFQSDISAHISVRRGLESAAGAQGIRSSTHHTATSSLVTSKPVYRKPGENQSQNGPKTTPVTPNCVFCKQKHYSNDCQNHKTLAERRSLVGDRCYLCLSKEHKKTACSKTITCRFCKKVNSHNAALCPQQYDQQKSTYEKKQNSSPADKSASSNNQDNATSVEKSRVVSFIRTHQGAHTTACVTIINPVTKRKYNARVLFDNGSNDTYISEKAARRLGLTLSKFHTAPVKVFAVDHSVKIRTASTSFIITNNHDFNVEIAADTINQLPQDVHLFNYQFFRELNPKYADTQFINQGHNEPIDILLGSDYYFDILRPETKITVHPGLYLFNTPFGWMLVGRQENSEIVNKSILFHLSPQQAINTLASLEAIGIKDEPLSALQEEENALQQFYENITFQNGRYEVRWPWREFPPPLQDNFGLALARLKSQQRKFTQEFFNDYNSVIETQIRDGIVEEVQSETTQNTRSPKHYLPHHAVLTPNKSTSLRIVHEGNAKPRKNMHSINEMIYKGRNLLTKICAIQMRFRLNKITSMSDLEKAFNQLGIHPDDRDFVRFLWLYDWKKPPTGRNLRILRFMRVAFGIDASPFLLNATLRYHLQQNKNKFTEQIERDIYSDNVTTGFPDISTAKEFYHMAIELFRKCSMNLRAWATNDDELRSMFQQPNLSNAISILGIIWNQYDDTLKVRQIATIETFTLRNVLSVTATFFDPCGWWCPITSMAKIFIRELHIANYEWDDNLSEEHKQRWILINNELRKATSITLSRLQGPIDKNASYQLHIFADASVKAYACVIYLHTTIADNTTIDLIISKAKLAPKAQEYKMPHLELFGVVLAIKTLVYVREELPLTYKKVTLWCDNKCVLSWIKGEKILPVFVQRRIDYIHSVPDVDFRYVPSEENAADLPSRGGTCEQISESRWFEGPMWLVKSENYWPSPLTTAKLCEDLSVESLSAPVTTVAVVTAPKYPFDLDAKQYNSYQKLIRVTFYLMKFLSTFQLVNQRNVISQHPTLYAAQLFWIKTEQGNHYYDVITALKEEKQHDLISKLNLELDSNGLIRCAGRFKFAPLSPHEKSPILLPGANVSSFVTLLVRFYHENLFHAGCNQTLNAIRRKFWIPKGRHATYNILKTCTKCKRFTTRPFQQPQQSNLPLLRLEQKQPPFTNVGIDTFGPVWVNETKRYVLLVTDLVIRAVDLELLTDMTTDEIFLALRRIFARRTTPHAIISDNAPQFKAIQQVFEKTYTHDWTWKYIPEHAPWMGGAYERLVKMAKNALLKTFHGVVMSDSLLRTTLSEIAFVLNDRPLTYVSAEQDTEILTPNYFLHSYFENSSIEDIRNVTPVAAHVISLAKQKDELTSKFWCLWRSMYLQYLRERGFYRNKKFPQQTARVTPRVNEIVLISEPHIKRSKWKLGKIIRLHHSDDKQVRSISLRTQHGTIIRPVSEIFPLELEDAANDNDPEPKRVESDDEWENPIITVEEIDD